LLFDILDLPHPFRAENGQLEKGHITVMRRDLPMIAAHTAAGGPKRARKVTTNNGLDLRTRIPLARSARILPPRRRPKTVLQKTT
jgi:hypothetical protein